MIEVGAQAPDFTLRDAQGNAVSLKDYRGKKVVLYFYPREITPEMARAVGASAAQRVLIPVQRCGTQIAGVQDAPMSQRIDEAVRAVAALNA